ncbi:MAG: hypothetical protein R2932_12555 [Caldilineaceae bacterium]
MAVSTIQVISWRLLLVAVIAISFGGVALLPGSNQTALAAMDPNLRFASGGIKWLNNITGSAGVA